MGHTAKFISYTFSTPLVITTQFALHLAITSLMAKQTLNEIRTTLNIFLNSKGQNPTKETSSFHQPKDLAIFNKFEKHNSQVQALPLFALEVQ